MARRNSRASCSGPKSEEFTHTDEIRARALDVWRNGWIFREKSYSLRVHNAVVKAFFVWTTKFD